MLSTTYYIILFIVSLLAFALYGYTDYKQLKIYNKHLFPYFLISVAFFIYRLAMCFNKWDIVSVIATTFISIVILFNLTHMGGGDAKALICVSLALPVELFVLRWLPAMAISLAIYALASYNIYHWSHKGASFKETTLKARVPMAIPMFIAWVYVAFNILDPILRASM